MKKLLVLALVAIMVLSLAAASMAAVTVGGEVKVKVDLQNTTTSLDSAKVKVTAAVNDSVTGYLEIAKASITDADGLTATQNSAAIGDAYIKVMIGEGTLQTGKFGFGCGGLDLLTKACADLAGNYGQNVTTYEMPLGDALKAKIGYAYGPGNYAFNVAYAQDAIGANLYYQSLGGATAYALNGSYTMDALKVYLQYGSTTASTSVTVVGAKYSVPDTSWFGILEYDVAGTDANAWAIRVGNTFANGIAMEFNDKASGAMDLSFKVGF